MLLPSFFHLKNQRVTEAIHPVVFSKYVTELHVMNTTPLKSEYRGFSVIRGVAFLKVRVKREFRLNALKNRV